MRVVSETPHVEKVVLICCRVCTILYFEAEDASIGSPRPRGVNFRNCNFRGRIVFCSHARSRPGCSQSVADEAEFERHTDNIASIEPRRRWQPRCPGRAVLSISTWRSRILGSRGLEPSGQGHAVPLKAGPKAALTRSWPKRSWPNPGWGGPAGLCSPFLATKPNVQAHADSKTESIRTPGSFTSTGVIIRNGFEKQ